MLSESIESGRKLIWVDDLGMKPPKCNKVVISEK
jgi:hypothetical protein